MPSTTPDNFEFERFPDDEPGRTLTGGRFGTSPILAEQVQAKFSVMDAAITALTSRMDDLESGASAVGMVPIGGGTNTSTHTEFIVDLTAGGKYAVGAFAIIEFYLRFDLSATGDIHLQINSDSSSIYQWGEVLYDYSGGSLNPGNDLIDRVDWETSQSSWQVAHGATVSTNTLEATLFHTSANALHSFTSLSGRQGGSASTTNRGVFQGSISSLLSATPSTLRFFTPATSFTASYWWASGLKLT